MEISGFATLKVVWLVVLEIFLFVLSLVVLFIVFRIVFAAYFSAKSFYLRSCNHDYFEDESDRSTKADR